MTDTILIFLGCGWLIVFGVVFAIGYGKGQIRFDTTSMRLVLALVLWIGIAPILFGIATRAEALIFIIDLVVSVGLVVALCLTND
jgi:hypothetical protein